MRYLILSDIHANRAALDAVLADADGRYDAVVNLGDVVGYGPDPNYAVSWARAGSRVAIRGNHDKLAAGQARPEWFNATARKAGDWTRSMLTTENAEWVAALPAGPAECEGFSLAHGSPADEDEYITTPWEAVHAAAYAPHPVCFFGHSHLQGGFEVHRSGVRTLDRNRPVMTDEHSTWLINPGSVGQPRDGDPRAAWAIYDADGRMVEYYRTAYDVELTARRIREAGLPETLALRLYLGA